MLEQYKEEDTNVANGPDDASFAAKKKKEQFHLSIMIKERRPAYKRLGSVGMPRIERKEI